MSLAHMIGLDHIVVTVRDLDAAARRWQALGFTVSPRGTHSPHLGSANYTIVFDDDYIELLGVLTPTEHLKPTIAFLEQREGIERAAFTTDDAAAGADELRARGLEPLGPVHFGRPVELPGGAEGEARFNVFRWPLAEAPGTVRIFACQHLTRETVWIPALQRHANGARRLVRIEILAADPAAAAAHLSRLIDEPATAMAEGHLVPSGGGRADFLFYDSATFARLHGAAARVGAAAEGAVAVVIATDDAARAGTTVPAAEATGVIVRFVPA